MVTFDIPRSVQVEHAEIHGTLEEATRRGGAVGEAATRLAEVLHPHFVREEEIALPPLALLAPLAAGEAFGDMSEVLALTDALKAELPRMLEEHVVIRAAVENLRAAARAKGAVEEELLAEKLALHALTEEEVLYPAAIVVGELVRLRIAPVAPRTGVV